MLTVLRRHSAELALVVLAVNPWDKVMIQLSLWSASQLSTNNASIFCWVGEDCPVGLPSLLGRPNLPWSKPNSIQHSTVGYGWGFAFYLPRSWRHILPANFESYEEGLFLRQLDKQLIFLQWSHHALTPQSSHYPSTNSYLPILIFTRINLSISPHRPAAYQLSQPESNDIIEMLMTLYNTLGVPLLILVVTLLEAEHLTA